MHLEQTRLSNSKQVSHKGSRQILQECLYPQVMQVDEQLVQVLPSKHAVQLLIKEHAEQAPLSR
jgi:hypothetical protein